MAIDIGPGISIGAGISFIPEGGGGLAPISGSFEVGQNFFASYIYGASYPSPGPGMGYLSDQTPLGIMSTVEYDGNLNLTTVIFNLGTFGSYTVSPGAINDSSLLSITVGGITETRPIVYYPGPDITGGQYSGDIFNLQARNTQTLAFAITVL